MKTLSSKFKICVLLGWLVFCLIVAGISCRKSGQNKQQGFQFVEATIDDLENKDIQAIVFMDWYDMEEAETIKVLGDLSSVESITGKRIQAEKVVNDPAWLERVIKDFLEAKRIKRGYLDDARAVFITRDKGYMIKIAVDGKVVYGPDYESEQLRKDIEEIGLLK